MNYWKIYCMEDSYPGLWRRWLREQCVAVGWKGSWGYLSSGPSKTTSWGRVRPILQDIKPGDFMVVHLRGNRVGRIGEVVRKEVTDSDWQPTVPKTKEEPEGELGRRILVRWTGEGPFDPDLVVQLDDASGFSGGSSRRALASLSEEQFKKIQAKVADEACWCRYGAGFSYERSLSDYIADYPHLLEDGLQPYPNAALREQVFVDKSRSDVLLMDRAENPVVVECKQGAAEVSHVHQLRKYMKLVAQKLGHSAVRGILVHGGARRLAAAVSAEIQREPAVTAVRYRVDVDFDPST